jgi:hypothetical protein
VVKETGFQRVEGEELESGKEVIMKSLEYQIVKESALTL